jgi:hypothetical protein
MSPHLTALKFRVKLNTNKKFILRNFNCFDNVPVRRNPADFHSHLLDHFPILIIKLIAMAMAFRRSVLADSSAPTRYPSQFYRDNYQAPHGPPLAISCFDPA